MTTYGTGTFLEPLEPSQHVFVYKVYYTSCPVCGARDDYSDTLAEARRAARQHAQEHENRAEIRRLAF